MNLDKTTNGANMRFIKRIYNMLAINLLKNSEFWYPDELSNYLESLNWESEERP